MVFYELVCISIWIVIPKVCLRLNRLAPGFFIEPRLAFLAKRRFTIEICTFSIYCPGDDEADFPLDSWRKDILECAAVLMNDHYPGCEANWDVMEKSWQP